MPLAEGASRIAYPRLRTGRTALDECLSLSYGASDSPRGAIARTKVSRRSISRPSPGDPLTFISMIAPKCSGRQTSWWPRPACAAHLSER